MGNRYHRLRSSVVIGVSSVVTALVIATASVVLLAATGITNFQSTQQSADVQSPVTASIEVGSVEDTLSVAVHSSPESRIEIPTAHFGSGVVTSTGGGADTVLDEGDVLISIDELPVIVIQGSTPAYRSLGYGMHGKDVAQLQAFLDRSGYSSADEDGSFGRSTAVALAQYYESRDFPIVTADGGKAYNWGITGFPLSRYVFVASTPVIVGDSCGTVGTSVDALSCTLQSQASSLAISTESSADLPGRPVALTTTDGSSIEATVGEQTSAPQQESNKAENKQDEQSSETWYRISSVPKDAVIDLTANATVTRESSSPDGLRVPATAIWENANGETYVREASHSASADPAADHTVTVTLCSGGYCAITGKGLSEGMEVVLLG